MYIGVGGSPTAYVIPGREVWGWPGAGEFRCALFVRCSSAVWGSRAGWCAARVVRGAGGTRRGWYAARVVRGALQRFGVVFAAFCNDLGSFCGFLHEFGVVD